MESTWGPLVSWELLAIRVLYVLQAHLEFLFFAVAVRCSQGVQHTGLLAFAAMTAYISTPANHIAN